MIRNQNGYWMSPEFNTLFSPDDGAGEGGAGAVSGTDGAEGGNDGGNDAGADAGDAGKAGEGSQSNNDSSDAQNADIARLKAELAKQKNALDKATKEAGDARSKNCGNRLPRETPSRTSWGNSDWTKIPPETWRTRCTVLRTLRTPC